jgi:hypothetical protein
MAITKAAIDFTGYSGDALIPAAQGIHDTIVLNAALFPTCLPAWLICKR